MADLVVDVDALERFGTQLDGIRTRMNAAREWTHQYDGQMGAAEVEDALHDFAGGWKDGRKEIDDSLNALSQMLHTSAQHFRDADKQLADATKPQQK